MVVAFGLLQVAVVARDQLALELAAREAARAASVSADPAGAAQAAADRATSLRPLLVTVAITGERVSLSSPLPPDFTTVVDRLRP